MAALCFLSVSLNGANEPDPGQITVSVARLLENIHYSHQRLDNEMSKKVLRNYLESLDYNHLFFTQEDVDKFTAQWGTKLDEEILNGRTLAAHQIYDVFRQRVEARVAEAREFLKTEPDFNSDRSIEINRQKAPWPASEIEAQSVWRDRLTSELLQERLSKSKTDSPQRSSPNATNSFSKTSRSKLPKMFSSVSSSASRSPTTRTPNT